MNALAKAVSAATQRFDAFQKLLARASQRPPIPRPPNAGPTPNVNAPNTPPPNPNPTSPPQSNPPRGNTPNTPNVPTPGGNAPPPAAPPNKSPAPPPVPPRPPTPPSGNTPNAPGGNTPNNQPGGVIPALIAALRANTDATIKNTAAAKGKGGGVPNQPARADASIPSIAPLAAAGAAGAAGMMGLVGAISPGAVSTFTGSLQMLAGEIGKNFVPFIYQAADRLQDLTAWLSKLDPAFKTGLARILAFSTLGLGGLAVGIRVVTGVFGVATGAVRLFGGVLSFLAAHPVVLTIGAITAGVITLTGQWENLGKVIGRVLGVMGEQAYKGVKALGETKAPTPGVVKQQEQPKTIDSLVDQLTVETRRDIMSVVREPDKAKPVIEAAIGKEESTAAALKKEQLADLEQTSKLREIVGKSFNEILLPVLKRQEEIEKTAPPPRGSPAASALIREFNDATDKAIAAAVAGAKTAGLSVKELDIRRSYERQSLSTGNQPFQDKLFSTTVTNEERASKIAEAERRAAALKELKERVFGTGADKPTTPAPDAGPRDEVRSLLRELSETTRNEIERVGMPAAKADVVDRIVARTQAQADAERKTASSLRAPLPFEGEDKRLATLHAIVGERRAELESVIKREMTSYQKVEPGADAIPSGTDQFGRVRLAAREQEEKLGADARLKALGPLTAIESKKLTDALALPQGVSGGKDVIFPKLFDSFDPPKPKFDPAKLRDADAADARVTSLEGTIATLEKLNRALRSLKPTADELIESLPVDVQRRLRGANEKTWADTVKQLVGETEGEVAAERKKLADAQRADSEAARGTNVVTRVHEALQEVFNQELASYRKESGQPFAESIPAGTPQYDRVIAAQKEAVQDAMRLATAEGVTIPPRAMLGLETLQRDRVLPFKPPPEPESRVDEITKRITTLTTQKTAIRTVPNPATGEVEEKNGYLRNFVSPINSRFTDATSFAESVQTQAFNVGDLEAVRQLEILEQQLKEQEDANGLLKDLNKNIEALRSAVGRLRFWEGP